MVTKKLVTLDGDVAAAILHLVFDQVGLPPLRLPQVLDGEWEAFSFRGFETELTVTGGSLRLACFVREGAFPFDELERRADILNQPSWFELNDGSRLEARLTHPKQWGGIRTAEGIRPGVVVDLDRWSWTTGRPPSVWVGRLMGGDCSRVRGNLCVRQRQGDRASSRNQNLRVDGQCIWHVLNVDGEDDPILVVVIPAEVGREAVATDFMALQFALGRPLVLETLVGTDADLKPVSAMGLRLGVRGTGGHRCPVPERLDTTIQWQAALFQRVAQAQCGQGVDTLTVPLGAYLDGIASHIDLAYLAAQVGLEAFATRIVRDVARQPIVKSSSEWLRWVKANEDAISEHAVDADAARKLLGKINNAHHGATGERVEAALRLHQLAVPEEVVEEIRRRSRSVHGYVMSGVGPERDIIKDESESVV